MSKTDRGSDDYDRQAVIEGGTARPGDEEERELHNLKNTKNGRCGCFWGETKDDAIEVAAEFWGVDPQEVAAP